MFNFFYSFRSDFFFPNHRPNKAFFFSFRLYLLEYSLARKDEFIFCFTFGLLMDFMQGTVLGVYPLILILISYLSQRFFYQFRPLKYVQQAFIIFFIFLIFRFFLALDLNDADPNSFSLVDKNYALLSLFFALLNSLIWAPVFYILRIYRRKWIKI